MKQAEVREVRRLVLEGVPNDDSGCRVDVEFADAFAEFRGCDVFAVDDNHTFFAKVLKDFGDKAANGFDVILMRIESSREKFVHTSFGFGKIRSDSCENVPTNDFLNRQSRPN